MEHPDRVGQAANKALSLATGGFDFTSLVKTYSDDQIQPGTTEPGADASGGATGWGTATGAGGNPEGTVGAMGSGTLPAATAAAVQGSAVMKSLEEFIETNAIDAVVADSLRNVVGESLAILQDIDNKVAAGQNPADAAVMKTKEHDRVKAAVVTLLGPVTGTALWETLYP